MPQSRVRCLRWLAVIVIVAGAALCSSRSEGKVPTGWLAEKEAMSWRQEVPALRGICSCVRAPGPMTWWSWEQQRQLTSIVARVSPRLPSRWEVAVTGDFGLLEERRWGQGFELGRTLVRWRRDGWRFGVGVQTRNWVSHDPAAWAQLARWY